MGLFSSQIETKKMVGLCRQLGQTYHAGIPIAKALDMLGEQTKDKQMRSVLTTMQADITNGSTLGEAADKQSKYLPPFFIQLVSTGEYGGKLDVMLKDLAEYYEDRRTLQQKIVGSMIYPIIQLTMAWFLGTFSLMLVARMNYKELAMDWTAFFADYIQLQTWALIALAGVTVASIILSRLGILRWITGWVAMYIWPFAPATRRFAHSRFFRSLSLLIGSGMNIIHCIKNSAAVAANPYIEKDLVQAVNPVQDGATLAKAFSNSRYIPPMAMQMLVVGEQSGNLEGQLIKVSEYMREEAQSKVRIMITFFNVLTALFVGGVVGYVVISFYLKYIGGALDAFEL
jgi:type IV pilus assembly protein PilC